MRIERITPENALGKGWARLKFNDCAAQSELATMAIVRPRHTAPFLGRTGWQIAECRLPLNIALVSASELELLLQPAIVQHLEVASNYEFCFFNSNLQRINSVVVRWSGVSYRAPRGEVSPIEIVTDRAPANHRAPPRPTLPRGPDEREDSLPGSDFPIPELSVVDLSWLVNLVTRARGRVSLCCNARANLGRVQPGTELGRRAAVHPVG